MKVIGECTLREVQGKKVLLIFGGPQPRYLEVNDSFALLWEKAAEGEFTADDLASVLTTTYGMDAAQARTEADATIALWKQHHLLEG